MKRFLQKNIVLVAGIMLPLILIVTFWLATILPPYFVSAPQYNLILTTNSISNIKFDVVDKKLKIRILCSKKTCPSTQDTTHPLLYIFDVKSRKLIEINTNLPSVTHYTSSAMMAISTPALVNTTINTSSTSPDGYQYNDGYYYMGLLTGSFYDQPFISKNGYHIPLLTTTKNNYHMRLIGWIIPEKGK
jgi:hypothetical protein